MSLHDTANYYAVNFSTGADGSTVVSNVAGKIIKVHRFFIQSTADGATDLYLYEETSGTQLTAKTQLNAREGRETAFASSPACICKTTTPNKKILLKNAATKTVNGEVVYSLEDG